METTKAMMDQVRTVLSGGDWVEKEHLLQLATNYVLACRAVNEKAYQCRDLLREGLRKDATKLANEVPKLIEEAGILNCPERTAWVDLCESAGLEVRQYDLDAEVVTRVVKDLSTDARKLTALLKLHRRLALGRAPLGERLRVLRQIARADPQRTFWQDDVRTFETARREELTTLARRAAAAQDADNLALVLTELKSPDWSEQPPAALVRSIEQMIAPFRQRKADKQFAALAEQLHQAHGAQREPKARELLAKWHETIKTSGVDPPPALAEGVGAIEAWLSEIDAIRAEEQAFGEACNALRKALDEERGRAILEKLVADILRFGRAMPEVLERRARTRIEELRRAARRRFTLAMTAIVGGLLLVAAGVAAISMWQHHLAERKRLVQELSQAVDAGDPDEADRLFTYLQENDPDLLDDPEILAIRAKLDQMLQAERDREAEFRKLMAKVEETSVKDPDWVSLNSAEKLARLEEEKILVAEWKRRIKEYAQEHKAEILAELNAKLDQLEKRLLPAYRTAVDQACKAVRRQYLDYPRREVGDAPETADLEEKKRQCDEVAGKLTAPPGVEWDRQADADKIPEEVDAEMRRLEEQRNLLADLQRRIRDLPRLCRTPGKLADELARIADDHGEHPLAEQFRKAGEAKPLWVAAAEWQQRVVPDWGGRFRVNDARQAGRRLAKLETHLADHPDSPYREATKSYEAYLQAAKEAFDEAGLKNLAETQTRLRGKLIVGVYAVKAFSPKVKREVTFYTKEQKLTPMEIGGELKGYWLTYIDDGAGRTAKGTIKPEDLKAQPAPAPQTFVAAEGRTRIQQFRLLKGRGWETFYLSLAEFTRKQPDLDPVLRAQLLAMFLTQAAECAPFPKPKQQILAAVKPLEGLDLDTLWVKPFDQDVKEARDEAAEALKSIPPLKPIGDSIDGLVKTMGDPLAAYSPIGLVLGKDGEIRRCPTSTQTRGKLYVLRRPAGGEFAFTEIGQFDQAGAPVLSQNAPGCPQGSVVYVRME